jgi:hypothetical protein
MDKRMDKASKLTDEAADSVVKRSAAGWSLVA